jgi:hypothetical protein
MSDERSPKDQNEKTEGKSPGKDITPVLRGWDYEPGTINVRKVSGIDGSPKLQMRQDLGLLQMEITGRPDGRRPHGYESLLEYFETQLADHRRRNEGNDDGFHLSRNQCQSLRDEAMMYYWRYLSLFVLEDFSGVVRDTSRNLRVLDLCGKFAVDEQDQLVLEQYRPYIIMMNTRAQASIEASEKRFADALRTIDRGLADIKEFFEKFAQEDAYSDANEVRVLKRLAREIRKKLPVNPLERLERRLEKAVRDERYEDAAELRDRIASLKARRAAKKEVR